MKNMDISFQNLKSLPKDSPTTVNENFNCRFNKLTSLKGAPRSIGRDFYCCKNKLISLKGGPKFVKIYFSCWSNRLISLDFLPLNYMIVDN